MQTEFIFRPYTKKELALNYFPNSLPRTAVNHLMSWINRCPELLDELARTGYTTKAKSFTPRQVHLIVKHIGEP